MKTLNRLALPVLTLYLWVVMTVFGAIVLETFMVYPNVAEGVESVAAHCDEEVKSLRFGRNPMKIARSIFGCKG